MPANEFGATQFGKFLWGGISEGAFPASLRLYLRNYLNDEINVGDSYIQTIAIFNITSTQTVIFLNEIPTPFKSVTVLLNGILVSPTQYSINLNIITFNFNLVNGNVVTISYSH